jgi:hypothetical protein
MNDLDKICTELAAPTQFLEYETKQLDKNVANLESVS